MHFLLSSTVALAGSALAAGSPLSAPFSKRATGLESAAAALGKYFGSATQLPSDDAYMTVLNNTADFGQVTPENAMKWDATEPSRGSFSYSGGDALVAYANAKGYKARCHTLVWHSQLPSWVSSGGFNNATLISIMTNHITTLMTRWKGKCMHWDVVNEALNEDGSYRTSVFYNTIGEAYIPIAFKAAAAADPDAKLYYNDYNIEYSGSKATGAAKIVKLIQSYGARIDGVGLQSHFIVGSTPSDIATVMKTYTDLDVDVAITELDIRMPTPATDASLAQQKTDYSTVTKACVNTSRCVGITAWQFTDKYSWVPDTFSGQGAACPWDENMQKKPAYDGILSALGGSASSTSTATATTTMATTTTTSAAASTSTVAKWGQCGGINYTGSTVCESGTTCTKYNDWYSQCV